MTKQTNHTTKKRRSREVDAMKCIANALKTGYADFASNELPPHLQKLLQELDSVGLSLELIRVTGHSA